MNAACRVARRLLAASCAVLALLAAPFVASGARPAGANLKHVTFGFAVEGLDGHPDQALAAYPTGTPGAPGYELAEVRSGDVFKLGPHSHTPRLYMVDRQALDGFLATHPVNRALARSRDPEAEAFLKTAVACDAAIARTHMLPKTDPRDTVVWELELVEFEGKRCRMRPSHGWRRYRGGACSAATGAAPRGAVFASCLAVLALAWWRRGRGGR